MQKATFQIGQKKCLWFNMLLGILREKKILWKKKKKKGKKNQKDLRVEKVIKRKGDKIILNGKATTVFLIVGLIKKT